MEFIFLYEIEFYIPFLNWDQQDFVQCLLRKGCYYVENKAKSTNTAPFSRTVFFHHSRVVVIYAQRKTQWFFFSKPRPATSFAEQCAEWNLGPDIVGNSIYFLTSCCPRVKSLFLKGSLWGIPSLCRYSVTSWHSCEQPDSLPACSFLTCSNHGQL